MSFMKNLLGDYEYKDKSKIEKYYMEMELEKKIICLTFSR